MEVTGSSPVLPTISDMYCVYVLQNPAGFFYKGHTRDLRKRIQEHNAIEGVLRYTKRKGPWVLVYSVGFATRGEAMKREKYFKSGKGRDFLKEKIGTPH